MAKLTQSMTISSKVVNVNTIWKFQGSGRD